MAAKTKKRAAKTVKGKKRWSSGSYRSCSNCKMRDHNIRSCEKSGGGAFKKMQGTKKAKKK